MTNALALVTVLLDLTTRAAEIAAVINKARMEGRDVTSEELDALFAQDAAARQKLADAIAAA